MPISDLAPGSCPKCGFQRLPAAIECPRCGVVFAKLTPPNGDVLPDLFVDRPLARPVIEIDEPPVADGRIGRTELLILGGGLVAAVVVYALPFTRFVFSALVTLFHELGHAVAGWLLGHPSLPAFDLVYGGGLTHYGAFRMSIAIAIAGAFAWALWLVRYNRRSLVAIGAVMLVWLLVVSAEWRRELVMASAGHLFEFGLAGVLFYKALSGVGWKVPEVERPLGAFVAFFVQIHSMLFAWRLMHDPDFLAWYREGKGGALMNDLESIALDLRIHTPLAPSIEAVARALLVFSAIPIALALIWYFRRSRWHRVLRTLRTVGT